MHTSFTNDDLFMRKNTLFNKLHGFAVTALLGFGMTSTLWRLGERHLTHGDT